MLKALGIAVSVYPGAFAYSYQKEERKDKRKFAVYRIDINDPLDSAVGRTEFPKFVSLTAADNALPRRVTCWFGSRVLLFPRS